LLPVHISLILFCSSCFTHKQVISSGILFSTLSKSSAYSNVAHSPPFLFLCLTRILSNFPFR
jgi:hypothetical protein